MVGDRKGIRQYIQGQIKNEWYRAPKYLGSMFAAEGGSETDVNNRVKVAWAKWREVPGVMCDKKMPIKLKDKIYKTIVKPAMIYGSECWAVKQNDTQILHTTDMRMLRWARGKTKKDHVKNEDIWREANVEPMTTFLRKKRLRWCGHVLRKSRALTGDRTVNGSSPAAVKTFRLASELWQFRLPRLASVFRMRH